MELTEEINVQDIISKSFKKSLTYSKYRADVEELVAKNSTSGNEKTQALIDYTMLNDRRMRRWDKTIKVSEVVKAKVTAYAENVTWLVLTESWCGDAAHVIPVINKIANLSPNIDLKIVYRDENETLMNMFLTNGSKSVPKLIMVDKVSGKVLNTFGPRPSKATQVVLNYKAKHGVLTPEFKEELQQWYNKDKGETIVSDLLKILDL